MEKKITKNGKMTLDKLAGMMARGFDEVNEKVEVLGKRMDDGFEIVNDRLGKVETRLGQVEYQVFELKTKESVTDKAIEIVKRRVDNMERRQFQK